MKIAIISGGQFLNKKGFFNSVHNRAKELLKRNNSIDVYFIESKPSILYRILNKRIPSSVNGDMIKYDGLIYRMLYIPMFVFDYILSVKLHLHFQLSKLFESKYISQFKEYDIIIAQSLIGSSLALKVNRKYNIPYIAVWHGSDINYVPTESKEKYNEVYKYVTNATLNVYVSMALMKQSFTLFGDHRGEVIYNGIDKKFKVNTENNYISQLRKKYLIENKTIVAFVGGLVPVKNVLLLPDIFNIISNNVKNCQFWIIGDGKYKSQLATMFSALNLDHRIWGDIDQENIIEMYNCINLLVLPSKNEGMPLVLLEALACGCKVVASNVGGISEVLDQKYVVPLDENFVTSFAKCCVDTLNEPEHIKTPNNNLSWEQVGKQEYDIISRILDK